MENHRNGLGTEGGNIVLMEWHRRAAHRGESGERSGPSIGEFGRRERCGKVVGYPEPAELSTGERQGKAAHPLHLAMRSKNDQTAATR